MSEYDENFCRACEFESCEYAKSRGLCHLDNSRDGNPQEAWLQRVKPIEYDERQLAAAVASACITRGVLIDDDLVVLGWDQRWHLTKPRMVSCPKHGMVNACNDIENGCCPLCSDEFHKELAG